MNTKQVVAVVGASERIGSAIATAISKGNYRVVLQSENFEKVACVVNQITRDSPGSDVEAVPYAMEACWEADIIILAISHAKQRKVAEEISQVVNQKIVISMSIPVNDADTVLLTSPYFSAVEELQAMLPHSKVITVLNCPFTNGLNELGIDGQQLDCLIAGYDEHARQSVGDLVKNAGFNPVIVGNLAASRTLPRITSLLHTGNKNN
jgi:8-hydroxy-5-deazaflavin:NADPH oxidoreductase